MSFRSYYYCKNCGSQMVFEDYERYLYVLGWYHIVRCFECQFINIFDDSQNSIALNFQLIQKEAILNF